MTKEEIITKLKEEYGVEESKTKLRGRNLGELQEMLTKHQSTEEEQEEKEDVYEEVEEAEGAEEEKDLKEEIKTEIEVVKEIEKQLSVFKEDVVVMRAKTTQVEISNKGYGDVYVSDEDTPQVGNVGQLIPTGDSKVIEGVKVLRMISASQPVVKITEMK